MKDGVCEEEDINAVSDGINNMNISSNNASARAADSISVCANCGKEGDDINNICNKCKLVKYCNAACKKKHRHKHKKDCEEHLRRVAEKHDEELFKQPPSLYEDCPICFLRLPYLESGCKYMACCGKTICSGCKHAVYKVDKEEKCSFCRIPIQSSDGIMIKLLQKRMETGDAQAISILGNFYSIGLRSCQQDYIKALELWHRAAELGHTKESYNCIGYAYDNGRGVEVDKKQAKHYYELGAIGGDVLARHNLGILEEKKGNSDRALKHYFIAVASGDSDSLKRIKRLYSNGNATKEDYTKALLSYQEYLGEIKSDQRDKAAAADNEMYRYY